MLNTPDYCRLMARYNAWQNDGLRRIVETMDDAALRADRGAFFGSILATLNHLLWADQLWMSRFDGGPRLPGGIAESVGVMPTAAAWAAERFRTDARITAWAAGLRAVDLAGTLSWQSGAAGRQMTRPRGVLVVHFFNHQTHHRGQVHAMLTAAGLRPRETDLFLMPGERAEAP
jgi:uncharacterized damage-inducible protein DinB